MGAVFSVHHVFLRPSGFSEEPLQDYRLAWDTPVFYGSASGSWGYNSVLYYPPSMSKTLRSNAAPMPPQKAGGGAKEGLLR